MTEKYFPKPINNTDEFFEKLELEGKVRTLDSPEDLKAIDEVNKSMEETRRHYLSMNAGSIASAKNCYIN